MKYLLLLLIPLVPTAHADQELLKKHACVACHTVNMKLVGPAYRDVASKYRNQKGSVEYLSNKIRNGGKDVWGPIPMPPNTRVTEAEAKQLAIYILDL
jgi:cytochrome c